MIKTNFLRDETPKENVHYNCIAYITIDSVTRMERKNCPQLYLEEPKYKAKKTKMTKFINTKLDSDSESDSESESLSDMELKAKP